MRLKVFLILISVIVAFPYGCELAAMPAPVAQTKTSSKKSANSNSKKSSGNASVKKSGSKTSGTKASSDPKKGGSKGNSTKKGRGTKKNSGTKKATRTESSADVKRQQEATQREISETKKQIQLNDASIKKGVDELGRLQGDISDSKEKVKVAATEVAGLNNRISGLEKQVADEEAQLEKLRTEYLKAIKKMRAAGKSNSTLAFIFSSGTFNQAMRRMRYLKQFSEWKDRQSAEIAGKVEHLKNQRATLSKTLSAKDAALRQQQAAQTELEKQYSRQDAIVVELRANGQALNAHLSKKQAEANALRSRISSLIAAEEQQRRAREEQARRDAEAAEARKRQEAEARAAREEQARRDAEAAEAARQAEAKAQETAKKESKQTASKKQEAAPQKSVPVQKVESSKSTGDYASARQRKPRSEKPAPAKTPSKASTPAKAQPAAAADAGSFEKMRGSLPRPVSGAFRITSPFGRHSLPELPDVVYDNPGIDAQTSAGASAQAVYGGKVSGVYVIPGFSTVVIVNHGNYYTVYGNIASPAVKVGDSVKQGQNLGKLAVDEDDSSHSAIHFEVWRNRDKLNPSEWIR
ncbi:MAG: peptidoglycan DD-metalloendopeptidase family protein [Bacteroides sp.]|nr:peptidoglycan DD-metalloendopeptidase family protein [Bacteroides sp.]